MTPQSNHAGMRSLPVRYPIDEAYLATALQVAGWVALAYAAFGQVEQAGEILRCARELRDAQKEEPFKRHRRGLGSRVSPGGCQGVEAEAQE